MNMKVAVRPCRTGADAILFQLIPISAIRWERIIVEKKWNIPNGDVFKRRNALRISIPFGMNGIVLRSSVFWNSERNR